mgnify:CR=1 FL=1
MLGDLDEQAGPVAGIDAPDVRERYAGMGVDPAPSTPEQAAKIAQVRGQCTTLKHVIGFGDAKRPGEDLLLEEVRKAKPVRIVFDSLSELRLLAGEPPRDVRAVADDVEGAVAAVGTADAPRLRVAIGHRLQRVGGLPRHDDLEPLFTQPLGQEQRVIAPEPECAYARSPGRAFASAMSSFTLLAGSDGCTTSMLGAAVICTDDAVIVPAGARHNVINTDTQPLKLYTLYAPPNHRDGIVHHTRADAEADNEHFDGKTTE